MVWLGIPTIRDRVIQTTAKLVLEPIFEADFEDNAYGYRPARGAVDAVKDVHRHLSRGYAELFPFLSPTRAPPIIGGYSGGSPKAPMTVIYGNGHFRPEQRDRHPAPYMAILSRPSGFGTLPVSTIVGRPMMSHFITGGASS